MMVVVGYWAAFPRPSTVAMPILVSQLLEISPAKYTANRRKSVQGASFAIALSLSR
jgi:hypothetical protein